MTHPELVSYIMSAHVALFAASLTAYYKYGDRSQIFSKSLKGTDSLLQKMRREIAVRLGNKLKPVFEEPDGAVVAFSGILDPSGKPAKGVGGTPTESEKYKNALFDFVETDVDVVIDYPAVLQARNKWCCWARFLSSAILRLIYWQSVVLALCGSYIVLDVFDLVAFYDIVVVCTLVPSALGIASCLVPLAPLARHHDIIMEYRSKHDTP